MHDLRDTEGEAETRGVHGAREGLEAETRGVHEALEEAEEKG